LNTTILKGIISVLVGALVFFFMFLGDKNSDWIENLIWAVVSSVLGYFFIAPLLMSDKEMEDFEKKVEEILCKDDEEEIKK
jgi:uncharacterized protein YacL